MGRAMNPAARKRVWRFFEIFLNKKEELGLFDFEDLAYAVWDALRQRVIRPIYDSIIIDEAQDLSSLRILALSALVKNKDNGLMVISDQNQRIFRLTGWRRDVKLDVVGRTFYLDLNYRTTRQIREYADSQFVQSQMETAHIRTYKSIFLGPEPEVHQFSGRNEQYRFIVSRIRGLLSDGFKLSEICVVTPGDFNEIEKILDCEEIPFTVPGRQECPGKGNGVIVSTLYNCKGLEFRTMIMANCQDIGKGEISGAENMYSKFLIKKLECLKYVAVTRSRENLLVTFVAGEE